MAIGVVILAHNHLERVRQLVRTIASQQCKVVVHVDAKTELAAFEKLASAFSKNPNVSFSSRISCEWGRFSLVKAGLEAAQSLLQRWPEVTHVTQISGSCLPVRRIEELTEFLAAHPDTDFVENRAATENNCVIDGLRMERFTLYFPFSWRRQRWMFDRAVELQRKLNLSRTVPEGLTPHIGSQWWTLSAQTLKAILRDPERSTYDRFFRHCWIPDESYVPTLVHKHSSNVVNQSLCLTQFDDQGKPFVLYDDHLEMLAQTDFFFARKAWHGADKLYRTFATRKKREIARTVAHDLGLNVMFEDARAQRCKGRPGRVFAGRFPAKKHEKQPATCNAYSVLVGYGGAVRNLNSWLTQTTGVIAHGRLFARQSVAFAGNVELFEGAIAANPRIRDANPEQFLCNVLWSRRNARHSMLFEVTDSVRIGAYFARDPNAQVHMLRGGWLFSLANRAAVPDAILAKMAERHMALEDQMIAEASETGRSLHVIGLSELCQASQEHLSSIQEMINPNVDLRPNMLVQLEGLEGVQEIIARLARMGVVPKGTEAVEPSLPLEKSMPRKRRFG